MLYYYPVRSLVLNTVKRAVLLDMDDTKSDKVSVLDASLQSVNIKCMTILKHF